MPYRWLAAVIIRSHQLVLLLGTKLGSRADLNAFPAEIARRAGGVERACLLPSILLSPGFTGSDERAGGVII